VSRVWIVLRKEWLELRQQRLLILTILALPLVLTATSLGLAWAASWGSSMELALDRRLGVPAVAGVPGGALERRAALQAAVVQQFSLLFLLMPVVIPGVIAAQSIVGEKTARTLEPVLATPIRTWELLVGKGLSAVLPAVAMTWTCAALFVVGVDRIAVSPQVVPAIITPAWLLVLIVCTPLLALIAIALILLISSRVNDPRSAQQVASVVVIPIIALFVGNLTGLVALSPALAAGIAAGLAVIAALALWIATRLFARETILTRWR